jgi:alcohol dehydrogenase (cytochrome c)
MPLLEWCMRMGPDGFRLLTSGVGLSGAVHPDADDGMISRLQAVDVAGQELKWVRHLPSPMTTSALATAGGVIFVGDMEPSLKAIDDASGEILWQAPLDDMPSCNLVTYRILDRQYVAVIVGFTNNHIRDLIRSYGEYRTGRGETVPDSPKGGAAIWVFAL